MEASPRISTLLSLTAHSATARFPELHRQWSTQSTRLASSVNIVMLMVEVQNCGNLDLLLRSLEDEHAAKSETSAEIELIAPTWQSMLSDFWIGKAYQIAFVLTKRKYKKVWIELNDLLYDLELLRVPLEKHEIAKDSDLKGASLQLVKSPRNGDQSDFVEYRGGDPGRSHIMPRSWSERGSITWCAIDIRGRQQKWLERRELADRFLALTPPQPAE